MRPMYENSDTLTAERNVVLTLCDKWNSEAVKLPIAYNVDYGLFRDETLRCWLEVKCRNCTIGQYETYFISYKKIVNGLRLADDSGKPFILAVQWSDALGWIKIERSRFEVKIGGRRDRNDWQDVEPMAHFKTQDFQLIK